jgi:hypothetical protein
MTAATKGLAAALIPLMVALQFAEPWTAGFPLDSVSSEALLTTALVSLSGLVVDPLVPEPSQALVVDLEPVPQYAKAFRGQLAELVQEDRHPRRQLQ